MSTADDWVRIDLTQKQVMRGFEGSIQTACLPIWMAQGAPQSAAMFARKPDGPRRRSVFTELYFSPVMAGICHGIIALYNPVMASAPPREDTALLLGNGDALKMLTALKAQV